MYDWVATMNWVVLYYETGDGRCELQDFIDAQKSRNQEKLFAWIEQLEEHGPLLQRPLADVLEDGIHELRIKLSGNQVRVLYFFVYRAYIVLTHSFVKTSSKVPKV